MALPTCLSPLKEMLQGCKLVLTSNFPDREKILRDAGLDPTVDLSDIYPKFSLMRFEGHTKITRWLSEVCGKVAYDKAREYEDCEETVVIISVYSVVTFMTDMIGKPYDKITNFRMLEILNGKHHKVVTGVNLLRCGGCPPGKRPDRNAWRERYFEQKSSVKLKHMSLDMVNEYIALEESLYHPGGYNIGGKGLSLVESIEGTYPHVKGFPLFRFCNELRKILSGEWLDSIFRLRPYPNPSKDRVLMGCQHGK